MLGCMFNRRISKGTYMITRTTALITQAMTRLESMLNEPGEERYWDEADEDL